MGIPKPLLTTNMDAMWVDYNVVIDMKCILDDDYMGMVTTIFVYAIQERALMDKRGHFKDHGEQCSACQLLFTSWSTFDFMYPNTLPIGETHYPSIDSNARREDEWGTTVSSSITTLATATSLLWPCRVWESTWTPHPLALTMWGMMEWFDFYACSTVHHTRLVAVSQPYCLLPFPHIFIQYVVENCEPHTATYCKALTIGMCH